MAEFVTETIAHFPSVPATSYEAALTPFAGGGGWHGAADSVGLISGTPTAIAPGLGRSWSSVSLTWATESLTRSPAYSGAPNGPGVSPRIGPAGVQRSYEVFPLSETLAFASHVDEPHVPTAIPPPRSVPPRRADRTHDDPVVSEGAQACASAFFASESPQMLTSGSAETQDAGSKTGRPSSSSRTTVPPVAST